MKIQYEYIYFVSIHSVSWTMLTFSYSFHNILYERLFWTKLNAEAVVRRCSSKQVFLNILQYSPENTYVGASFQQSCRPEAFFIEYLWRLLLQMEFN